MHGRKIAVTVDERSIASHSSAQQMPDALARVEGNPKSFQIL